MNESSPDGSETHALAFDNNNNLYVGTSSGNIFESLDEGWNLVNNISTNTITQMGFDSQNNIYFLDSKGNLYESSNTIYYSINNPGSVITFYVESNSNTLYFGVDENKFVKSDIFAKYPNTESPVQINESLVGYVKSINFDSNGIIVSVSNNGTNSTYESLNGSWNEVNKPALVFNTNNIPDSSSILLSTTNTNGIVYILTSYYNVFTFNNSIFSGVVKGGVSNNGEIDFVATDNNGNLYAITGGTKFNKQLNNISGVQIPSFTPKPNYSIYKYSGDSWDLLGESLPYTSSLSVINMQVYNNTINLALGNSESFEIWNMPQGGGAWTKEESGSYPISAYINNNNNQLVVADLTTLIRLGNNIGSQPVVISNLDTPPAPFASSTSGDTLNQLGPLPLCSCTSTLGAGPVSGSTTSSFGYVYKLSVESLVLFNPESVPDQGNITVLAADSANNIYAATDKGNVYKSINSDTSWSQIGTQLVIKGSISSLAIDPNNNIYAGTNSGNIYQLVNNNWVIKPTYSHPGVVINSLNYLTK